MANEICEKSGVKVRIPSQYEIPYPVELRFTASKRRGMFNLDSLAAEDNWAWDDCSNAIHYLSRAYAARDELSSANLFRGDTWVEQLNACIVAEEESRLNSYFSGFGSRSQLYEYLTCDECRYIDRVCRSILPLLVLEAETEYPCEPNIVHGLAQVVYPIMLPIVRDRLAQGDTGWQG